MIREVIEALGFLASFWNERIARLSLTLAIILP